MSRKFVNKGETLQLIAPSGGVTVDAPLLIGGGSEKVLVVPVVTAAEDEEYAAGLEGVYKLPKESTTAAFVAGDPVFWDDTNKEVDESAVGRFKVGFAVKDAAATDTEVEVKLDGQPRAAV